MNVSKEMAVFFMEQCIGETSGHMAMIPNNPVLSGIGMAHGIGSTNQIGNDVLFAEFCKQVGEQLNLVD